MQATASRSLILLVFLVGGCTPGPPEYPSVEARGDLVQIPLSKLEDGAVHFRTFRHDGKNVNILVRPDGEGRLHAHLDACYSCYRYKRGYVVEGDALVCVACRLRFPLKDEVWELNGACAPIAMHSTRAAGSLVITRSHLERAARYF